MKKAGLILGLLLVLGAGAFACGRAVQVHAAPAAENDVAQEKLIASYYDGQQSRAFQMLHKSIFRKLLVQWAGEAVDPVWNYDSFTAYQMPDTEETRLTETAKLYCCTYSGADGTYGYVVVAYEGNGLTRISLEKTPYLFDLKANWEAVMAGLKEAGIDPDSAEASRVRIADENTEGTAEAVRITDDSGNSCLFRFDEEGVVFLTEEAPE
nr:hypothetical protein [uncultured Eisenbergiella sp.]